MKKSSIILTAMACFGLIFYGCKKQTKSCNSYTERRNNGHLVDVSSLASRAPEFLDSLEKYPQLQVFNIRMDNENIRMDCFVYHKGLRMFSSSYGLMKTNSSPDINKVGHNETEFDITIPLTPSVTADDAVNTARAALDFEGDCLTYTLGIFDINALHNLPEGDYKLAWRVEAENSNRSVTVDAQTNKVLTVVTGILHD